jgi:hypothetical protein
MIPPKPLMISAIGALILLLGYGRSEARLKPDSFACQAATALLDQTARALAGQTLVLSDEPYSGRNWTIKRLAGMRWKDAPPAALAQAFVDARPSSPVRDCPGFADHARAEGVKVGEDAMAEAEKSWDPTRPGAHGTYILSMSTPVVDRREALVEMGLVCGGLCASSSVYHMVLTGDGYWIAIDNQAAMVS